MEVNNRKTLLLKDHCSVQPTDTTHLRNVSIAHRLEVACHIYWNTFKHTTAALGNAELIQAMLNYRVYS